jgi:branched-chain amino acid transport system permease protein
VGAVALTLLDRRLSSLADYRLLVYGGILLAALFVVPQGIVGAVRRLALRPRWARPLPKPSPVSLGSAEGVKEGVLLHIRGVTKEFSGLRALDSVSFDVNGGSIHAVVGPNGAGKTTLLNVVSGVEAPTSGTVLLGDEELTNRSVHGVAEAGVARTFQNLALFSDLSVMENVMVGLHLHAKASLAQSMLRTPAVYKEEEAIRQQALGLLQFVGLEHAALTRAGDLPQGHQRLLEVARAIAARPRLLLLDEPAAGLNATEVGELGDLIVRVRDAGITVLFIEHHMDLVMRLCDRVTVLDYGELIAEGSPAEVQANQLVVEAYLGPAEHAEGSAEGSEHKQGNADDKERIDVGG